MTAVSNDRRPDEVRVFQQLFQLRIRRGKILDQRIVLILGIDHRVKTDGVFDRVQFSTADPEAADVDVDVAAVL